MRCAVEKLERFMNKDVIFSLSRTVQTTNVSPNTPSETQRQLSGARGKVGTGEKIIDGRRKLKGKRKSPWGQRLTILLFISYEGILKPGKPEYLNTERRNT